MGCATSGAGAVTNTENARTSAMADRPKQRLGGGKATGLTG